MSQLKEIDQSQKRPYFYLISENDWINSLSEISKQLKNLSSNRLIPLIENPEKIATKICRLVIKFYFGEEITLSISDILPKDNPNPEQWTLFFRVIGKKAYSPKKVEIYLGKIRDLSQTNSPSILAYRLGCLENTKYHHSFISIPREEYNPEPLVFYLHPKEKTLIPFTQILQNQDAQES